MFFKNKSRLCGVIMLAALLLSSCSQNEASGTVTFTISQEVAEKITAYAENTGSTEGTVRGARTVTYSGASESEIFMDIVLQSNGDYTEMATVKVANGSTAEFKSVPANLSVHIDATAYKLEKRTGRSQLRTDLYEGKSSEIIVQGGENNAVTIALTKLPVEEEKKEDKTPAKETEKDTKPATETNNNQSTDTTNQSQNGSTTNSDTTDTSGNTSTGGTTGTSTTGGTTSGDSGSGSGSTSGTSGDSGKTSGDSPTTADYTVVEWRQNITEDGFTKVTNTTTLTGTVGTKTTASAATYTGFIAPTTIEQQTIAADGSTIVNLYYTRETYTVTYNQNGHTSANIPSSTTYRYGAKAQTVFDTTDVTGWSFGGWFTNASCADSTLYDSTAEITGPVTLYAKWIKQSDSGIVVLFNYYATDINITRTEDDDYITFTAPQADGNNYAWWFEGSQDGDEYTYQILKDNLIAGVPYDLVLYLSNYSGSYSAFVQVIKE